MPRVGRIIECVQAPASAEPLRVTADDVTVAPNRAQGRLGIVRGALNEARVLRVLEQCEPRPWWLVGARQATRNEDAVGIDVVVYTRDLGTLHLQVKSGRTEARKFRKRERERGVGGPIGMVVVKDSADDLTLCGAVLYALIDAREQEMLRRERRDAQRHT